MDWFARPLRLHVSLPLIALACASCDVLLPPLPNSEDIEGEELSIEMVDDAYLTQRKELREAFGFTKGPGGVCTEPDVVLVVPPKPKGSSRSESLGVAVGAALATAIVGGALDSIQAELEEEAETYVAQYETRAAQDRFWVEGKVVFASVDTATWATVYDEVAKVSYEREVIRIVQETEGRSGLYRLTKQRKNEKRGADFRSAPEGATGALLSNYMGFVFRRTTCATRSEGIPALELACKFELSSDARVFSIAPVSLQVNSTKAKILDRQIWPWAAATWFLDVDEELKLAVDVGIDALWIDAGQRPHLDTLASFPIHLPQLSVASPVQRKADDLKKYRAGWFPAVPRSALHGSSGFDGLGTFWIEVRVTESDTTQAAQLLKRGAEGIAKNREKIIEYVREVIPSEESTSKPAGGSGPEAVPQGGEAPREAPPKSGAQGGASS